MFTTLIDSETLSSELDNPRWRLFDTRYDLQDKARGRRDYCKGHIPGAIYLDLHEDLSAAPGGKRGRHPLPSERAMQALFAKNGIEEATQVVVYDDSGGAFAARLWWMLRHFRHEAVAVLDGGWSAWLAAGGRVGVTAGRPPESGFGRAANVDDVVTFDEVLRHERIIDSREPARYRGEHEPIDPVAGHIPTAVNRFWQDNLSSSGRFKSRQALRQEFVALFQGVPARETVFYCGSGVTACHNLLAATHAGLPMPKLYAGSWSEWSNTPGAAIATET